MQQNNLSEVSDGLGKYRNGNHIIMLQIRSCFIKEHSSLVMLS